MPSSGTSPAAARPALQTPAELLAAGRPADAAEALAAVVADAPTYAAAYVLLGVALDAAGRPAEALTAWHRAAFLVPRSPLVLRERQRLIDAAHAADDAHASDDAAGVDTAAEPAWVLQDADAAPNVADARSDDWLEPAAFADVEVGGDEPVIETAPLDDFVFIDAGGPAPSDDGGFDPDGFDPSGFDFSAFDADEDDGESWLGTDAADAPAGPDAPEPSAPEPSATDPSAGVDTGDAAAGDAPSDPVSDWNDRPETDGVRILLPDDSAPVAPAPPEADEAWAVFEDLPATTPPPATPPSAADMLTPDGAPAMPAAEDDWFVDAAFAAPTPVFHEPDEPAEMEPDEPDATEPDAFGTGEPVASEPIETEGAAETVEGGEPVATEPVPEEPAAEDASPPSASVFDEPAAGAGAVADELDLLIASLETAPRIRPDPTFAGPAVHVPAADTGEMASETLARIYAAQHQYVQAALVYETLAAREPERAEALLGQAAAMRARRP